ncbi:shikimate dehydrogenase family protein [Christiangramia aquimixticola]|uniref:shikimate dehydrogenase family protein n=1 Tax=Christiangramia aquimixticola TaxID=1697558 RepID=UPI003AA82B7D
MRTFGLIGKNIDYSFSRKYFADKFQTEKIEAEYLNFDIPEIEEFPKVLQQNNISGLNVTIPYKEKILPYLDRLDPDAEKIGAVNTIRFEKNGSLTGYNTDFWGFQKSLENHLENFQISALILGTGGASKAVTFALDKMAVNWTYVSRNPQEKQYSYSELTSEIINSNKLIINTTPLGTFPKTTLFPSIPAEYLSKQHLVFDLIYNPAETRLMKLASRQGAKCVNGLEMLQLQAEKAWAIWNE